MSNPHHQKALAAPAPPTRQVKTAPAACWRGYAKPATRYNEGDVARYFWRCPAVRRRHDGARSLCGMANVTPRKEPQNMTVAELVDLLQNCDPDAPVRLAIQPS